MQRDKRAFTLVELMVVLGLLLICLGLLMPAVNRARANSNAVKCRAQLHDIGIAIARYSSENRGYIAPRENFGSDNFEAWPDVLYRNSGKQVLVCPVDLGTNVTLSYLMNSFVRRFPFRYPRPPQAVVLVGEGTGKTLDGYHEWAGYDATAVDWVADKHGRELRANYLWGDFHVDNSVPTVQPGARDGWDPYSPPKN